MDVYIPEDYVKSRYNRNTSMQNRDGRVCSNDIKEAVDEKKLLPPDNKNKLSSSSVLTMSSSTSSSHSHSGSNFGGCSSFKEDILLSCFTP